MGLDVYLYKYDNKSETDKKENEYETISENNWKEAGGYDRLNDTQKESVRSKNKSIAESLGLDEYGSDKTMKEKIEIDSKTDPEHYFKIGYFRSSYNDGGINHVLENLGIPTLYEIFEPNDEYCFQPNWKECLERCNKAIKKLEKKGNYRCFDISQNIFGQPECKSEKEALSIFIDEISKKDNGGFEQYSNRKGHFYHKEPLKVLALISGTYNVLKEGIPCTYVICEGENEWYLKALKITKETIEYVLNQPDQEKYWLHWSS